MLLLTPTPVGTGLALAHDLAPEAAVIPEVGGGMIETEEIPIDALGAEAETEAETDIPATKNCLIVVLFRCLRQEVHRIILFYLCFGGQFECASLWFAIRTFTIISKG